MRVNDDNFFKWLEAGYPRPQLCREDWHSLNGEWGFQEDPNDVGLDQKWYKTDRSDAFGNAIIVPFPPDSKRSGYAWRDPQNDSEVVWYKRTITAENLTSSLEHPQWFINFEAVDYECDVWVNGQHAARHRGGYTPFSVRLEGDAPFEVVVRAKDCPIASQPRGKQSWRKEINGIWYERSTGIWRDVWLEARPGLAIEDLYWRSDVEGAQLIGQITLSKEPEANTKFTVRARSKNNDIADILVCHNTRVFDVVIPLPQIKNNMDSQEWLWAPAHPNLIDLFLTLESGRGVDRVVSYAGIRSVSVSEDYLHINGQPVYIRGILDQGYWPESYFTAPFPEAIRDEIRLILDLGFNLSRIHERTPDRRYLAWADSLGLLLWAEFPSSYVFDDSALTDLSAEWLSAVRRDRSSPSIITWVPINESWGVPQIAADVRQRAFVEGLANLTRAVDDTRPISSNDGWEQPATDIVTTHDYADKPEQLQCAYVSESAMRQSVNGIGPQGRRTLLDSDWDFDKPVIVSEFGGIALAEGNSKHWGYRTVGSKEEYEKVFRGLVFALLESPFLAGFCYTQLTDTAQEVNGICTPDRKPKLPKETVREIITGSKPHDSQVRPRVVTEHAVGVAEK